MIQIFFGTHNYKNWVYIEKLFWSEHYEITGMILVAISHKVFLFNPILQQTILCDTMCSTLFMLQTSPQTLNKTIMFYMWRR